jgi:O-methyltransferase
MILKVKPVYMLAAIGQIRRARRAVAARMLWGWKPLMPEDEFTACCRNAIQTLRRVAADKPLADYLEFGVSRGTSLACMYRALESEGQTSVRLLGFDSFEGLPPEAAEESCRDWEPGAYKSTLSATHRYLAREGVDPARITLVKGWFKDTLTLATRERLGLTEASLILVDCDIYSASRDALWFSEPAIHRHAVIFFDDWGWRSDAGEIGQKEAFEEFLAAFPQLVAEPLPAYRPQARVFLITRRTM